MNHRRFLIFASRLLFLALLPWMFAYSSTEENELELERSSTEEDISNCWEKGEYGKALSLIEKERTSRDYEPVWDLYYAISLDYGLGLYRNQYEAGKHYQCALIRGENRARHALADLLKDKSTDDPEDARKLTALRMVLRREPKENRLILIRPFRFGLAAARHRNLEQVFKQNRSIAIESGEVWAIYNTHELMPYNPEGSMEEKYYQSEIWRMRASRAGASPMLHFQGFTSELGISGPKDEVVAIQNYKAAAAQGYADSEWEMGMRYARGDGVEKDLKIAYPLLEKGSRNSGSRMGDLAGYFHDGDYFRKNMKAARYWYEKAIHAGDAHSASELGRFHESGWAEMPVNLSMAEDSYRLAANRGAYWGQYNLGRLLLKGTASGSQIEEGRFWMEMAAYGGHEKAIKFLAANHARGKLGAEQDLSRTRFWLTWGLANDFESFLDDYIRFIGNIKPVDWEEMYRVGQLALNVNLDLGLLSLGMSLENDGSPYYDPDAALAFWLNYEDRSKIARTMLLNDMIRRTGTPEYDEGKVRELIRELENNPEGTVDMDITNLLLLDERFQDPLKTLKEMVAVLPNHSFWKPVFQDIDGVESYDAFLSYFADKFPPMIEEGEPDQRYAIRDRKLVSSAVPVAPIPFSVLLDSERIIVKLKINPDGTVSDLKVDNDSYRIFHQLAINTLQRWRWEPDDSEDPKPFWVRIPIVLYFEPRPFDWD